MGSLFRALLMLLVVTSVPLNALAQSIRPLPSHVMPSGNAMLYAAISSRYIQEARRQDIRKLPPVTATIVFGQMQNYAAAYYAAANEYTVTTVVDQIQAGLNQVASVLPSVNPSNPCPTTACSNVDYAIEELNLMASQINVYNGNENPYFRSGGLLPHVRLSPALFRSQFHRFTSPNIPGDYATAGLVIGEAFIFVALVAVGLPLLSAAGIAIAGGAVVALAAYAYASITNAPENEFVSDIVDSSTGALVVTGGLAGGLALLPASVSVPAVRFITSVTPFSTGFVKGIPPALQPLSAILALMIAANVYHSTLYGPKHVQFPADPAGASVPASYFQQATVQNGVQVCVTFNDGSSTCWVNSIGPQAQ